MMQSFKQQFVAIAAIFTLFVLPGGLSLSQAAFDPTLPEPLIQSGKLPPESADGPYQHWQKRNKYFLVIAVNDTGLPNTQLPFTLVDAQEIATALTFQGYQPLDPNRPILTGAAATRSAIIKTLKNSHPKKDRDLVLLYFTGHGITGSKDLWLQTYGQEEVAEGQGISLADLVIRTRNKKDNAGFSGELTIILDTCFSGESTLSQALNLRDLGKRLTLFASSSENQESFPLNDPALPKISAFTASLLQALGQDWAEADTDGDGMLRYAELHIYAKNQLKTWAQGNKVAQLMEPTLLTNITEGFLAYQREQIRVWNTSYRKNLQTEEFNKAYAKHLQTIGPNPQAKLEPSPEAKALAQGLIPEPEDFYAQALKEMGEGDLEKARTLFVKAEQQTKTREKEEEAKRQEALKQQQEAESAKQAEQDKRYDLYLARARMESYDAQFTEAFSWYQKTATIREPTDLDLINEFGLAGLRAGKYPDAEPYLQQALLQREETLDPNHPDIGISLNNLAALYQAQGKYADAEPLFQRALRITETALGPDHPKVGIRLNNLAVLYDTKGSTPTPSPSSSAPSGLPKRP